MLNKYFWNTEKQMSGCTDDARRLWKPTECCVKASLITYPDSWEYWCVV